MGISFTIFKKLLPIYLWPLKIILVILLVITLMVSAITYKVFTIKETQDKNLLMQEETSLKNELVINYRLYKSLPLFQAKLQALNDLESVVSRHFSSTDDLPSLLIEINQVAQDVNLSIQNLTPVDINTKQNNTKTAQILTKSFNLQAVGSIIDFNQFLLKIAQFPRVIELSNINLTRIDDKSVNINLNLTIFYSN